ncbi:MAG: response regulator [Deltaproteobacteria bacterium]|nr:response regulator [Deltaproteobacteria bacterium]
MRTLIVEDSGTTRRMLAEAVADRGHDVTALPNAEVALEAHMKTAFPIMILDWILPGMDGIELCRKIRALPNGDEPVIIIITSHHGTQEHIITALDAGVNDFIVKPIDPLVLNTRLTIAERTVLERARLQLIESVLQNTEASFRTLIEGSTDGIIVISNSRILYVNPAALRSLGYEHKEQLIGSAYFNLIHPEDRDRVLNGIRSVLASGAASPAREQRFVRRDGGTSAVEVVSIPLEFEGEQAVAILARDLTERKKLENQLIHADRMVSVGTLAAGIAHEINNPLTYVRTNLTLISEELHSLNKELSPGRLDELLELLAQTQDGTERVRLIVRDLKSFSRAEDDDTTLRPVDLHRVLESSISMAWNEIRHRAQLEKQFSGVTLVKGNVAKLGQVFLNLLVNAAQALPIGSALQNRITVRTYRNDSSKVVVEIEDTGSGIPEEIVKRIFDPFFTTKPVGVGTGLGLSICHSIVTGLGGEITVDSKSGVGTTMRVILEPAVPVSVKPDSIPALPSKGPKTGLRILIVDDEPGVARSLRRALRDHDVTISLSGREAIEQLKTDPPFDLIFCDLMMPDISGMDLYGTAAQRTPGLEKRMIFMTGGAFTQQARNFLESIPNKWLEKPFEIRQVQELVKKRIAA